MHYGSFAMNVMRMEKGFKGASELTNEVTLPEADVMTFANMSKSDFIGKSATEASLNSKLPWVCAYLAIDQVGSHIGHGGEAVLHNDIVVGSTTSVVYSYLAQCALAFAYLKPESAIPDTELNVLVAGELMKARVLKEAVYDPTGLLARGLKS